MPLPIGRFHVLTDYHFQQRYGHADLARLAIEGGADTIQFRQKVGGIRHVLHEAGKTADVCRNRGVPLIINDRIDAALACDAAGVHLGQTDFPIRDARRILGDHMVIGATATTVQDALRARDDGADYIGFGPVFETGSKANPASVKGLDGLSDVCSALDVPVIAIAGIYAPRVESVMRAGAHGIAVMTAISTATNPAAATREIRSALDAALQAARRELSISDGSRDRPDHSRR